VSEEIIKPVTQHARIGSQGGSSGFARKGSANSNNGGAEKIYRAIDPKNELIKKEYVKELLVESPLRVKCTDFKVVGA